MAGRPNRSLASRIKAEIKAQGVTGYALAKGTGIPQSTISRFMGGQNTSLETADRMMKYLGLVVIRSENKR